MMNEMVNLCLNLNIQILGKKIVKIRKINASTLIGKGVLSKILNQVSINKLNLLICNCSLTPNQQRNLENYLKIKVVDRSGIIIEIFAKRALSNEGKMQVQLAEMIYRKSRLVRAWTHLERQRGGTSFVGGPGELQIELDRRLIQEKIDKIKKKLKNVSRRRSIQRKSRIKNNFKIFALVGYTNAGKTQLFNRLTKENQKSINKLFSTLDTKISKVFINYKTTVGLIDTVGFINNIPTQLIESFKATFDEIHQADFIINVVDISDKNYKDKIQVVGINDLGSIETNAHLIKYDSTHGILNHDVKTTSDGFQIGNQNIKIFAERDPAKLPWGKIGAEVVLECTGFFLDKVSAGKHIQAGAKKVIVSAPAKEVDFTLVQGVNSKELKKEHNIISNGSCTTNCLAPVAMVLENTFGIEYGYMTTIHSYCLLYTSDAATTPYV